MNLNFANGLSTHSKSRSLGCARRIAAAAGALFIFTTLAPAFAQTPTLILMRAMPAKTKSGETFTEMAPITKSDITSVKIGGKDAEVTDVQPLLKGPHGFQLVVLLDSMQQIGINEVDLALGNKLCFLVGREHLRDDPLRRFRRHARLLLQWDEHAVHT